ncbi:MAG TPA: DUF402 domain-containing protein [Longimicrobiaceae bacterium]
MTARVTIHYRRPPDRIQVFDQLVLERTPDCTVTFLPEAELPRPVAAAGRVILEPGAPVVWFTYPGLWHDIGRFHLANGEFTGYYANILTPVAMEDDRWETTDLFLDVWIPADGEAILLDEEELDQAVELGWVDAELAEKARSHARDLLSAARNGLWPPKHVELWTVDRARDVAERISN